MNIFYCQCYNRYKNGIFLSYNSDICRDSSDSSNVIRSQSLFYEFQLIYPVSISSNLDECMFDNRLNIEYYLGLAILSSLHSVWLLHS